VSAVTASDRSLLDETTVVIACAGEEIDLASRVAPSIDLGARHIVVDLGDAEMLDASTLTFLKQSAGRLRSRGGRLSVVCSHPRLASLLDVTLLSRSFRVFPTLASALGGSTSRTTTS
jgi:anti-sigma B factor antagonist